MRVGRTAVAQPAKLAKSTTPSGVGSRSALAIGIGASTGGPPVLDTILGGLPGDFPVPVLVVQHMAPGFIEGFARWLDHRLSIEVRIAAEGDRAAPGVWFAPDGAHLLLTRSMRFALAEEPERPHRPSVDALLDSLGQAAGSEAVGVVLTGMGSDGAAGAAEIRRAGGLLIAQDESSSVVYGMPRAAAEGGADLVTSPVEIAAALSTLLPARRAA
jgi:two-component system chemotaxis response regulator CheB